MSSERKEILRKRRWNWLKNILKAFMRRSVCIPFILQSHITMKKNWEREEKSLPRVTKILKEKAKVVFNFHFFAGNLEEARLLLDLGAIFSFTGVITFTSDYDEIIKYLPLEKIMAETDCPFVAPVPHRGKRNEPVYVIEVVKKIAEIRGENLEKVRKQLLQNSFAFFNLSC